ncbi:MAG: ABC transporter ATP-binding protein [Candidatus Sericytochromatia bacterium]|nr:ABC transporter ATP-binding protein [Candidatus Sericytochromatia bacterium]
MLKSSMLLSAQNVSRQLGQTQILTDLSLEVATGEFVAIMGPSGSGKTTLLYLLGALDRPDQGEVYINGTGISGLNDTERSRLRQRELGFIFQFHFLLPELSALENVAIAAMLADVPRLQAEARATKLLAQVGLSHRLSHRPNQLSGGEQQRVAIARALINRPRLMLADEPTGNLDSENSHHIFELLQTLNQQEGLAIVLVTHDHSLANKTHRQIHLKDGQIAQPA